jgi:cell division protein FtsZ
LKGQPAHMFFLSAEATGGDRAVQVLEQLQGQAGAGAPPGNLLADSRAILVSIVGPRDLSMAEVDQLMARVKSWAPGATVMLGAGIDEQSDRLSCTLLASEYAPLAAAGGPNRPANEPAIPIEFDTQFYPASANRPASRFVPPPPELTPDAAEQLLARQSGNTSMHRKTNGRLRQAQLPLEVVSKGRFEKSEPTIRHGEDLDVPTFIRRGLVLP